MTNLPISISNQTPQTKGTPGDAVTSRSDPSATSGNPASQANNLVKNQGADAFSALLKRQIGTGWDSGLHAGKIPVSADGKAAEDAAAAAKNAQDQTIPSDQAGSLAAMMLQIPVENRGQSNNGHQDEKKDGHQLQIGIDSRQSGKPAGKDSVLPKAGATVPLAGADAVKHAEMTADTAAHSSVPGITHATPNKTKVDTVGATIPGMANVINGNTISNTAQTVAAPIGSNGWAGEFSQKVVWISNQKTHSAELHLNPPDLGPLNVVIKMSDNQLTAQFTSQHSAVRDAVENALPKLREILADNNIMLGNATVSDQAPRDRGNDGYSNQGSGSPEQRGSSYNATESNEILPITAQNLPASRHNGMLDTFA